MKFPLIDRIRSFYNSFNFVAELLIVKDSLVYNVSLKLESPILR